MERQRTVVEGVKIAADEVNAQAQYVSLRPANLRDIYERVCLLDRKLNQVVLPNNAKQFFSNFNLNCHHMNSPIRRLSSRNVNRKSVKSKQASMNSLRSSTTSALS